MEFIKTKNYGGEMTVVYDGSYYFIEAFHGLVAVAKRQFNEHSIENEDHFKVELTLAIDESKIKRIINKAENRYIECHPTFEFKYRTYADTGEKYVGSLPYTVGITLTKY